VSVYPPRRRSRREELLQSKHTDEAVPHNAEHDHDAIETQRGAKRRRTEQVVASLSSTLDVSLSSLEAMAADGDILDADQQQYWYYSEGLQLPASLAQSWASGVIQSSPTTTPSSPSSSSSSSPTSSSSLVASPHSVATADSRSSFSYQVVASPLPTLVLASASLSSSSCWSTPSGAVTPVSSPAMGFFSADGSSSLSSGTATTDNTLRLLRGDE
jgi:activator of HSP90 ATPase